MSRFHALTISEIVRETPSCVSLGFVIPPELKESFQFIPGQYLTFKENIGGEEIRRSYSISTSPDEAIMRVAVKKVEGGRFSTYANEVLKVGDTLSVMLPEGKFTHEPDPARKDQSYLAFCAGSGITPVMSLIKSTLSVESDSTFTLFYGNRSTEEIIYREELESLKNEYNGRLKIFHILSREAQENEMYRGRITKEKASQLLNTLSSPSKLSKVFLCGPEEMIWAAKNAALDAGIAEEKIKFELFTTDVKQKSADLTLSAGDEGKMSEITVQVDGEEVTFNLGYGGENILDEAISHGADLPFACKGGVCCTCKSKVLEGKVEMEVNYGLEPDEIENNFILTCQAHPRTEKVVLDFDV